MQVEAARAQSRPSPVSIWAWPESVWAQIGVGPGAIRIQSGTNPVSVCARYGASPDSAHVQFEVARLLCWRGPTARSGPPKERVCH
eukprot:15438157-Alexandrium_andersonii.AAC.1